MSQTYPQYSLTNFPDSLDNFSVYLDVTSTDGAKLSQYQNALEQGNTTLARQILETIPDWEKKVLSAKRFNQQLQAILAMEKFFSSDYADYIGIKQQEWQNLVAQFKYKNDFSPSKQYGKNNFVLYNNDGLRQLYINIFDGTTPIGTLPTNSTYWRVFTMRGKTGKAGESNTNFGFDWESDFDYTANSIVVYDNKWWIAKQPSQNQAPFEGSLYWELVLRVTQSIYPVQSTPPTNLSVGELWFKVLE